MGNAKDYGPTQAEWQAIKRDLHERIIANAETIAARDEEIERLKAAARILCDVHTRAEPEPVVYTVMMGATPGEWDRPHDYIAAWGVLYEATRAAKEG